MTTRRICDESAYCTATKNVDDDSVGFRQPDMPVGSGLRPRAMNSKLFGTTFHPDYGDFTQCSQADWGKTALDQRG